jgi:hypothetical protein
VKSVNTKILGLYGFASAFGAGVINRPSPIIMVVESSASSDPTLTRLVRVRRTSNVLCPSGCLKITPNFRYVRKLKRHIVVVVVLLLLVAVIFTIVVFLVAVRISAIRRVI